MILLRIDTCKCTCTCRRTLTYHWATEWSRSLRRPPPRTPSLLCRCHVWWNYKTLQKKTTAYINTTNSYRETKHFFIIIYEHDNIHYEFDFLKKNHVSTKNWWTFARLLHVDACVWTILYVKSLFFLKFLSNASYCNLVCPLGLHLEIKLLSLKVKFH